MIIEVLARFFNHHITPLIMELFEVFEKAVLGAKHLTTASCLLPLSLLFDACGSISKSNATTLKYDRVSNVFLSNDLPITVNSALQAT